VALGFGVIRAGRTENPVPNREGGEPPPLRTAKAISNREVRRGRGLLPARGGFGLWVVRPGRTENLVPNREGGEPPPLRRPRRFLIGKAFD
jgi:hypothetical protein